MAGGGSHRDLNKEQFWREAIGGQAGSGRSVRGYCLGRGLRESAFYFWRTELARRGVSVVPPAAFVPVRITGEQLTGPGEPAGIATTGVIEIVLGHDRRVRLLGPVDRAALGAVLAVLEGATC